jgi:hypothetical protein
MQKGSCPIFVTSVREVGVSLRLPEDQKAPLSFAACHASSFAKGVETTQRLVDTGISRHWNSPYHACKAPVYSEAFLHGRLPLFQFRNMFGVLP